MNIIKRTVNQYFTFWWLRSVKPGYRDDTGCVEYDGIINEIYSNACLGVAAMCLI